MNRTISFFIGLLMGIMICVSVFYINSKKLKQVISHITNKEVVIEIKTDTVFVETAPKFKKQVILDIIDDSVFDEDIDSKATEDEISIYYSEFSIENDEQDEIFVNQLLQTKTVKVKLHHLEKQNIKQSENHFQIFEIQHWSTPIKNKITYFRNQNMVKIKGMKIDNINIVFWNENYFLEIENRYYAIPETDNFIKLILAQIP
ncbi:MAG: hypothetical protein LBI45_04150 [Bacteroidales bacterium]|jgi:hypothetical protein|nr:hypothetical protein [Bacteroidales bacterium]